ncbi:MAG: hypothetical protein CO189_02850 [candidate division Zixibacteria bacterium CG_4_9_14_3_um_filter_46_8]|nr:MAG: hypothetical protein CO189_02850 [candidate division Zixibacteria bacterium CG_4_9_14_3_um_filter_46_8]
MYGSCCHYNGFAKPSVFLGGLILGLEINRLSAQKHLDENDSYTYFYRLNSLIRTGPTGTNVTTGLSRLKYISN